MTEHIIIINLDGTIECIYSDALLPLLEQGDATITRASNVEPTTDGRWQATMIDGTILDPQRTRQEALDAEVAYLNEQLLYTID